MIQFEIDHIKAILLHLEEVPHKYSANLIKYIKDIAEPQVKAMQDGVVKIQQSAEETVAEIQQ